MTDVSQRPLQVFEIFKEFFGEDRVDLQGLSSPANIFILVHFPRVKVTNEHDRFTFINHLYARVDIDTQGRMKSKFTLNRAEYTAQHFTNGYMHSHVCSIPTDNFSHFQIPCTGRGPINNTICSLNHDFDESIWRLFCLELDKYVQVESLAGVPYHRLEELTDRRRGWTRLSSIIQYRNTIDYYSLGGFRNPLLTMPQIAAFTKYVIDKNILRFNYAGEKYQLAMSPTEFLIAISNLFIKWYNKEYAAERATVEYGNLLNNRVLKQGKFMNGQIWEASGGQRDLFNFNQYIGSLVCTFKGQPVRLSITDIGNTEPEEFITILNPNIANYIVTKILNVINFRYGNGSKDPNEKGVRYI